MNSDMAFEGLVVSQNPEVLGTMNRLLDEYSIVVDLCIRPSKALDKVSEHNIDILVVDWSDEQFAEALVQRILELGRAPKPMILAVAPDADASFAAKKAGADLVMQQPLTKQQSDKLMKAAYSQMIRDYRRYARHALMKAVSAKKEDGAYFPVTITNISEGGIGLMSREQFTAGDGLTFALLLPGAKQTIHIRSKIVWTREPGMAGAQFLDIARSDLRVLYDWLWSKTRIQKGKAN